jgi:hypothetical protein
MSALVRKSVSRICVFWKMAAWLSLVVVLATLAACGGASGGSGTSGASGSLTAQPPIGTSTSTAPSTEATATSTISGQELLGEWSATDGSSVLRISRDRYGWYVAIKTGAAQDFYVYNAEFADGKLALAPPMNERGDIEYQPPSDTLSYGAFQYTKGSKATSSTTSSVATIPPGGGKQFIGTWTAGGGQNIVEISLNSGVWVIDYRSGVGHDYETHKIYSAKLVDGQLYIDPEGPVAYLASSDTILFFQQEYTRS